MTPFELFEPSLSARATGSAGEKRLFALLSGFKTATVVSREGKYLQARPMTVLGVDGEGALWLGAPPQLVPDEAFASSVQVVCHSQSVHVTVSGEAKVIERLPDLLVIKVLPTNGEFCDSGRSSHATLWRPAL